MKKEMKKIKYIGPYPQLAVQGVGAFQEDKEYEVSPQTAERLLRIKCFKEVTKIEEPVPAPVMAPVVEEIKEPLAGGPENEPGQEAEREGKKKVDKKNKRGKK